MKYWILEAIGTTCPFDTQYFIQNLSRNQELNSRLNKDCQSMKFGCLFVPLFVCMCFCLNHLGIPTERFPQSFINIWLDLDVIVNCLFVSLFVCLCLNHYWISSGKISKSFINISKLILLWKYWLFFCLCIKSYFFNNFDFWTFLHFAFFAFGLFCNKILLLGFR